MQNKGWFVCFSPLFTQSMFTEFTECFYRTVLEISYRRINFRLEMLSTPDIPIQLQKSFLCKHWIISHQSSAILSSLQKQFDRESA